MNWLLKNLVALSIGTMLSCAGMAFGVSMEVDGLGGLILGFFCGLTGLALGMVAVASISQKSKFTFTVSTIAQISLSVFMVSECGISMDSLGGVTLSSIIVSISLIITLCSLINEALESKEIVRPAKNQSQSHPSQRPVDGSQQKKRGTIDSKPVIAQTSVPGGFLMTVWSVKMKTWSTVSIQGKIIEGDISMGDKVFFYRSNQMIVADNIAAMEVGGRARSYAGKGEVVELILNWNNDAYLKNCTSVRKSTAR